MKSKPIEKKQTQEKTQQAAATHSSSVSQKITSAFTDNRPEMAAQRELMNIAANSPQAIQQKALEKQINNSQQVLAQRKQQNILNKNTVQCIEEETVQEKSEEKPSQLIREAKSNNTGLPDNLKSGIESLSGMSMDNVKVHYNSSQPAQLNALAYAQGTDIHVAPGQEQHLPHEAWHVVQQAQGRVRPTIEAAGTPVNDDPSLETEATQMGQAALQRAAIHNQTYQAKSISTPGSITVQREPENKNIDQELNSIISQLEQLKNEAQGLGKDDDQAPGLTDLDAKISELKKIASDTDEQKKAAALKELKSEIPDGDVQAIKAPAAETETSTTTDSDTQSTDTVSQKVSMQPVQRITGIEIAIVVGVVVGIGLIAGGVAAYIRRRKNRAIFNEFGNTHRNKDYDPDVLGEEGGGIHQVVAEEARPEDAPTVNYFRTRFHQLHSAKLYLEQKHPQLIARFEADNAGPLNNLTVSKRLIELAGSVKDESKNHKKRVKNLTTDTDMATLNANYTVAVQAVGDTALNLATLIQTYINDNSNDDNDLAGIHTEGTDIWRETWHRAIMAVNTVLHGRWPHWKGQITNWIRHKRDDDGLNYMDPRQVIGLDYIGSLAKGYKGPPKQAIRFTPEKFDVDANLTAPPLAAYALTVGGAIVDRGRIWSHKAGPALFNGLLKPMQDDIQQHLVNAGLIDMGMAPDEPFEAVIDAEGLEGLANAPQAAVAKKAQSEKDLEMRNKLFLLRHTDPERFQRVGAALAAAGYTHDSANGLETYLNEHDEENQTYAFDDGQIDAIDNLIDTTA